MPTKEKVYDEQINPLMAQIIAICKEHKIAHVCTFSLDLEEGLTCTSVQIREDFEPPECYEEIVRILFPPKRSPLMLTVMDKDGNVKEVNAIMP